MQAQFTRRLQKIIAERGGRALRSVMMPRLIGDGKSMLGDRICV